MHKENPMPAKRWPCPQCGSTQNQVKDTRYRRTEGYRYRRYLCMDCGFRWNTHETIEGGKGVQLFPKHLPRETVNQILDKTRKVLVEAEI